MPFELRYHPAVRDDYIPSINAKLKSRIKQAIETRLTASPHQYGEPLRKTLKGYWELRVGDYRVFYKITGRAVLILGIINRKEVYDKILKRT